MQPVEPETRSLDRRVVTIAGGAIIAVAAVIAIGVLRRRLRRTVGTLADEGIDLLAEVIVGELRV